ncbi:MAG: YajD family HNH nuclease [Methylococcaceae bacterium]|nr:YajD family HNH nuclease [Methylococcaceae bacterium]MCI0732701.1 YajD family HNH nuclease [Methylococcaceae bacterium]
MTGKDKRVSESRHEEIVAEARLYREQREKSYREQALKIFPWICGRCAREFTHSNLRELTVHHKDHDHDNNPEDGSNWELLCLYCHDNEHSRYIEQRPGLASASCRKEHDATFRPFAGLQDLLKK